MEQIVNGKKIIINKYSKQHYSTIFNKENGFFIRIEDNGYEEPFWAEHGPELLDISITNYCQKNCEFCYRKSTIYGKHLSIENLEKIITQAESLGVFQIALGGGNPNQHPQFIEILKLISDHNIIPTYTTNGDFLTKDILVASEKYCGAIAISAYPPFDENFEYKLKTISKYSLKVNLHYILKKDTINTAIQWLKSPPTFLKYINAIIFLNYKPTLFSNSYLANTSSLVSEFFNCVSKSKTLKIGFDSCCISGIVENMEINPTMMESCEAARFSAFISEDMKMYPCSFMINTPYYGDLNKNDIKDVWQNNKYFIKHRSTIKNNKCYDCKHRMNCNGGCTFMPEINFCSNNLQYNDYN